jgi:AcrR family transcriptional regulator
LIEAAIEVFLSRGYDQTRVQDIANRAGFTTGALYAHFDSRTSILNEAIRQRGSKLLSELSAEVERSRSDGTLTEALAARFSEDPTPDDRVLIEAFALAARDRSAREALLPAITELFDEIDEMVADLASRGVEVAARSPEVLRVTLTALTMGALLMRAIDLRETIHADSETLDPSTLAKSLDSLLSAFDPTP